MADDRSTYENSKTAPVSTDVQGVTFPPAAPAVQQNDTLAEHASAVAPTLIAPATCESSQFSTARDGGKGQTDVPQSGARTVAHVVGSDSRGDD
jgi:hypothetical protein